MTNSDLRMRASSDGGSTFDSSSSDYLYNPKPTLTKDSNRCHWRVAPTDRPERGGVIWTSECRHQFELLDGKPNEYGMRWCPFCGGELVHDRLAGMED